MENEEEIDGLLRKLGLELPNVEDDGEGWEDPAWLDDEGAGWSLPPLRFDDDGEEDW